MPEFMGKDISIHDANRQEVNPQALGFGIGYISEPAWLVLKSSRIRPVCLVVSVQQFLEGSN